MQCDQLQTRVDEMLDRRLDVRCDAEVAAHLAACGACARFVRGYEAMLLGIDLLAEAGPEDQFIQRTLTTAQRERTAAASRGLTAVAVAAGLLIAVGASLFSTFPVRRQEPAPKANAVARDDPSRRERDSVFPPGLSAEAVARLIQETGRGIASLPEAVHRVATHPETDRIVGHIRPLTDPMGATWDAILRSLPGTAPSASIEETDTGYVHWHTARHA